jgi:hypothetical protein
LAETRFSFALVYIECARCDFYLFAFWLLLLFCTYLIYGSVWVSTWILTGEGVSYGAGELYEDLHKIIGRVIKFIVLIPFGELVY